MFRYLCILVVFLLPLDAIAESRTSTPPSQRELHPEIAAVYPSVLKNYKHSSIDTMMFMCEQLERLATMHNDSFMMGEVAVILSSYYTVEHQLEEALVAVNKGIKYSKYGPQLTQLLETKAEIIQDEDPAEAERLFRAAVALCEKYDGYMAWRGGIYSNFANFLKSQGRIYEAAILYEKSLEAAKPPFAQVHLCHQLVDLFIIVNNWSRAEEYILKAVDIGEREGFTTRNNMTALYYAQVLIQKGELEAAKKELDRTVIYQNSFHSKNNYLFAYLKTRILYFSALKQPDSIRAILQNPKYQKYEQNSMFLESEIRLLMSDEMYVEALSVAKKYLFNTKNSKNPRQEVNAQKLISKIYRELHKDGAAYHHLDRKTYLEDSLNDSKQFEMVNYLEARYKRKEQEEAIAILDDQNEMKSVQLSQQKKILIGGGTALGLISILSFFLFRLYRKVNDQKIQLNKAVNQKDTLLREIHHRVKNNLQLVSSLLTLQSRSIEDQVAVDAINEGKARVRSMALIHQDLYSRENLTGIGLKSYLEKLTRELFTTYHVSDKQIDLRMDIQDLELDVDTIVPLGLIINELVTNSLKYAFVNTDSGLLNISLKEENGQLVLKVKDDGQGFDENKLDQSISFGSKLINTLSEQLEGSVERNFNNGTEVVIRFTDYKIAA